MLRKTLSVLILFILLAAAANAQSYVIKEDCFGWADDATYTLLREAIRSNDNALLKKLVIQGKLCLLNKGDLVTVTDMGFLSHTVYVRSGNFEGSTCIIASESLGDQR